ncbi:hypothetical protein E3T39_12560 [Cryobacterium suzukii]|uniref:Alpha/beta hydrolase n=1 Tax=Cryobacterium suzukii TaxID=1259198 RepID=A0A4R9ACT0_9MICO|nr:hypothetical protein [Cryobacterium suzukii]TFD58132.1 hypothetical protein E3T39_12560 [Cryobacterium suzukii]
MADSPGPGPGDSRLNEAVTEGLADQLGSAVRGRSGISDAFTRSNDRTTAVAVTALTRGAAAGGSIVATFADIELVTSTLAQHIATTQADALRILPMASSGDLLQSLILSPVTGAAAEGAVLTSMAALTLLVARSTGLGLIAVTVVSTYALADAALQARAAAIGFVLDATVAGVTNTVDFTVATGRAVIDGVVTKVVADTAVLVAGVQTVAAVTLIVETAKLVIAGIVVAGAAGLTEEVQSAWSETVGELTADPWLFLTDREKFAETIGDNFSSEDIWSNSIGTFEGLLGALGPGYDAILGGLIESASIFGWDDGATLQTESSIQDKPDREKEFVERIGEADLKDRIAYDAEGVALLNDIQPSDMTGLLLSMGQIDLLGGTDEAVIRVMTQPGTPPTFTLVIPSTQKWSPWDSRNPNDAIGILMVMQNSSALERMAGRALESAMNSYAVHNSVGLSRAEVFSAPVMVAGFSQGGITAASFAESNSGTYNIVQVVTAGSPIGNFDIPDNIGVIAYESDPVSALDGQSNPESWETITADNGGGGGIASHDIFRYAHLADSTAGTRQNDDKIDQFLGVREDRIISDYFAIKESP